jgi:steroid delta-isomerase-like uncharacterized protein
MNREDGLYERAHRFFQLVWNERNDEAVYEFLSPDVVEHGLSPLEQIPLRFDDFIEFRRSFLDAFPDAKFTVDNVVVDGQKVAVRFHVQATHLGDGLGFPATGRKVTFTAMGIARWDEGKIVEAWNNFDRLGLLRQLGVAD